MIRELLLITFIATHALSSNMEIEGRFGEKAFDTDLYQNVLDPELCQKQLRTMNVLEFYDASFRIPQGLLKGNIGAMGNFHQCLEISQVTEADAIEGKYCMVRAQFFDTISLPMLSEASWFENKDHVEFNANFTSKISNVFRKTTTISKELMGQRTSIGELNIFFLYIAMCIPKTCTVDDALAPIMESTGGDLNYVTDFCRLPNDKPLVAADYTAIVIFSIIGIVTILSTAYDVHHRFLLKKDPSEGSEILRCCSVYTNTKTLLNINESPSGTISCIDGIRALSITWVIVGHTFMNYLSSFTANMLDIWDWFSLARNTWLSAANLSVDTFFALSGLLLVFTTAKRTKQMQLVKNLHLFYIHRLLRMFPLLACMVLLQASVFHHVSDGVEWNVVGHSAQMCREYWWSTLLHIQNIVNPITYCLPQTWYLSVDVQLHILSPLILFWLLGSRRCAWTGLTIGVAAALTASTIYVFVKDVSEGSDHDVYFYKNPLTRCPPFLMGMIFGYILHIYRGVQLKLSKWFVCLGYVAAAGVSFYCVYQYYPQWENEMVINLNNAFVKGAWGLSVCWLIFACAHGYGGPLNWFLSLNFWKFPARISYAMYLIHYPILFVMRGSAVTPFYFNMENVFMEIASVMVYTVITSIAACVLIDVPFNILQRRVFKVITPSAPLKTSTVKESTAEDVPENTTAKSNPI